MYVCLCNGLTDTRIRDAVAAGACRPCEVYARCGTRAQCGTCVRTIVSMLRSPAAEGSKPVAN
ncbi:bacterioferritin-associated ferredoxin [Roseomonas sp. BN140053]|uniref:(2Fe-2S)-binding protein n=1 Tax=Roseomonas sp. BN140053 TaxID=3391898 RepID=UPI0039EB941F